MKSQWKGLTMFPRLNWIRCTKAKISLWNLCERVDAVKWGFSNEKLSLYHHSLSLKCRAIYCQWLFVELLMLMLFLWINYLWDALKECCCFTGNLNLLKIFYDGCTFFYSYRPTILNIIVKICENIGLSISYLAYNYTGKDHQLVFSSVWILLQVKCICNQTFFFNQI